MATWRSSWHLLFHWSWFFDKTSAHHFAFDIGHFFHVLLHFSSFLRLLSFVFLLFPGSLLHRSIIFPFLFGLGPHHGTGARYSSVSLNPLRFPSPSVLLFRVPQWFAGKSCSQSV
jgi:hypothetical protein